MKWSIYIIELASLVLYFIQFTGLCFPKGKHLHISTSLETGWLWTWDLCFSLLSAGIKGMYHHAWLPYKYTHTSLCGGLFDRISCVQAGLKLGMSRRMIPNSRSSCLYFPSAGITGMCRHVRFMQCWGWNHTPSPSSYRLLTVAHSGTQ